MLYIPWRNEESDILGNYPSYEDRYNALLAQVNCAASKFEHSAQEIDTALEDIKAEEQLDKAWDEIVPLTQHTEKEDDMNHEDSTGSLAVMHPEFCIASNI